MIKYLWQLPQNLIGFILSLVCLHAQYMPDTSCYIWSFRSSVSLGKYIFVHYGASMNTIKHERGHQRQSLMLGPLYLILIGLPSSVGNLLHRVWKFDYYKQPWEKWADELGGVRRYLTV